MYGLGIPPTTILESLVDINRFVSNVYMDDIANMIFQLHHLHLEQYCIQRQHDQNYRHLC